MKGQTSIILAIVFALIVAVFAVINVEAVPVNFLFATSEAPLILVILFSVLMGSIITGAFGLVRVFRLQKEIKKLRLENQQLNQSIAIDQPESEPVFLENEVDKEDLAIEHTDK